MNAGIMIALIAILSGILFVCINMIFVGSLMFLATAVVTKKGQISFVGEMITGTICVILIVGLSLALKFA